MPTPKIIEREDYLGLVHGFPINESEVRAHNASIRWELAKSERRFYYNVTFPKHVRITRQFEVINFFANMSQLGAATGILLHRIIG